MKKIFTLFAAVLMAGSMMAQDESVVQIGSLTNASTNTKFPWYSAYECSSSEIVYTSDDLAELPANSTLTKLEFAVIGGQLIYTHLRVWLENTDDVAVVASTTAGAIKSTDDMTKVYDTTGKGYPLDDREVNGYYEATTENPGYLDFAFDTPFTYTGGGLRIRFEAIGSNWCADEFLFVVDADKASENANLNCSMQYDFTEAGLRERPAGAERSFPIIKISYQGGTHTALENTTSTVKAQKLIENGQVVIIRDGVRYNAVGAKL